MAVLFTEGVKVAVYDVPEARFQLDSIPPLMLTSDSTKSSELCERVNVRVAVSLALREVVSELIAIVGLPLSIDKLKLYSFSLVFPAASENFELAIEMSPFSVPPGVGVNVAV